MVTRRSVGLVTRDPSLYQELAGFMRERRWPAVSLLPGDRIPESVAVVLTSPAEAYLIAHPNVITVSEGIDRRTLGAAVQHALGPSSPEEEIIVGIDPGPRPGYAVLVGAAVIGQGNLDSPESAGVFANHLRHRFSTRHVLFRVGSGDPPARNRIVNSLLALQRSVELVDEQGTTPRGRRRPRDAVAARAIAVTKGLLVHDRIPERFTPGEVANLQRLSREGSEGRVTISRSSAHRVLRGEITMAEAVDEALGRAPASRAPRRAPVPREPL